MKFEANMLVHDVYFRGGSRGATSARPPKIGKNINFLRKIVIFLHEIPQQFSRLPSQIGKKYDFLAENRDFSHEIPPKFSRLPPLDAIFLSAPPSLT